MGLVMKTIMNEGDFGVSTSLNKSVVMSEISAIVHEKTLHERNSEAVVGLKEFSGMHICLRLQWRCMPIRQPQTLFRVCIS
jgi:hypothetical protein